MRKRKKGRKLGREKNQRAAFLNSLVLSLFLKEKIKTTQGRAKELSHLAEKHISQAKSGGLKARRLLARYFSSAVVKKLVEEIGPRYKERRGGYTRIVKLGPRKSDGARMAIIELVK